MASLHPTHLSPSLRFGVPELRLGCGLWERISTREGDPSLLWRHLHYKNPFPLYTASILPFSSSTFSLYIPSLSLYLQSYLLVHSSITTHTQTLSLSLSSSSLFCIWRKRLFSAVIQAGDRKSGFDCDGNQAEKPQNHGEFIVLLILISGFASNFWI